jgi:hypothetical protein
MHSFAVFRVEFDPTACKLKCCLLTYHCVMNADCESTPHTTRHPDESSPETYGERATASSSGPCLYYLILLFASFFTTTFAG